MPGKSLFLGLLFAASLASAKKTKGCGKPPPQQGEINVNGRTALLSLPPRYNKNRPAPLIMTFHGYTSSGEEIANVTQYNNPSINKHYVTVFPNALPGPGGQPNWQGQTAAPGIPAPNTNDLQFVDDILDQLSDTLCLDDARFFASGFSNGGGFTNSLACDSARGGRFAAFGIGSGAMWKDAEDIDGGSGGACDPGHAVTPIIEVHGDADPKVPYEGTPKLFGIMVWLARWAERNACKNPDDPPPHAKQKDGYIKYSYDAKCELEQYKIAGLDHNWWQPNGTQPGSTKIFLKWFDSHKLQGRDRGHGH